MRRTASFRADTTEIPLELELRAERDDGLRAYGTRQRVAFTGLPLAALAVQEQAEPAEPAERAGEPAELRAEGGADTPFLALLEATASSTGKDSHGTEMTESALASMAEQMKGGVVYLPSHWESEWDEVIGRTVDAFIEDGRVALDGATGKPGDGKVLRVVVGLYADEDKAAKLARVVRRADRPVGTSIGGWFTDLEFLFNDDDDVERVLVHGVELDHLATTRRPSNRESWIDGLVERAVGALPTPPAPAAPLATRAEGTPPAEPEPAADAECAERAEPATVSPPTHDALDSPAPAGSTAGEPDAVQRAVPPDLPTEHGADDAMSDDATPLTTDERLDALARSQEALGGRLGTLVTLLTAQATQAAEDRAEATDALAPAPAADDNRAELERQNAELRSRLERTMTAAGRQGMAAATRQRMQLAGGFKGMVQRCAPALGDTSTIRMVTEAQSDRRDASKKETPDRESLEADLRSLLAAAYADGVITDPNERGGW